MAEPTKDYPLGGLIEPYDIEMESEVMRLQDEGLIYCPAQKEWQYEAECEPCEMCQ
jgi:hypothetical protein